MFTNRISIAFLSILVISVFSGVTASGGAGAGEPQAVKSSDGPVLGTWEFTGKDNAGLVWTGTLAIVKLDPQRFDANKYHSMCSLEVESTDPDRGTRGVEAPCSYDKPTRAVSFTIGMMGVMTVSSFTAVLSADGRSLTQGKWTRTEKSGKSGKGAVETGDWSAKLKQ